MKANTMNIAIAPNAADVSAETGMRLLLSVVIALFVVQDVFALSLSLGPGLSAKNAMLYALATTLAFKIVVQRTYAFEVGPLHLCFAVLIVYSIITYFTAAFVVEYPRYKLVSSGIKLKTIWIDRAIFFLVFFYALRETANAYSVLKILLGAVALANTIAVLDAVGLVQVGTMGELENGRVQGMMGEPNQDAAFIALFLPGLFAMILMSHGIKRLLWIIGLFVSIGAMLATASRGGFVAVILSALWGGYVFRSHVPLRRIVAIAIGGAMTITVAILALLPLYGDVLYRRVIGDSTAGDLAESSSGRTQIWSNAIGTMADTPITLLTGFGWNVYSTMPFRYAPHNYYLELWFNLGVVGLICGTYILLFVIRKAVTAVERVGPSYSPIMMAFAIGATAVAIATFFVDLYTPWIWFWAYAGLAMRIALNARQAQVAPPPKPRVQTAEDPFGWNARPAVRDRALTS
jgi:O-antigen ligase